MDNLTHALAGVALHRLTRDKKLPSNRKDKASKDDRALFWTAVVASNFPDLDFLYTWITQPRTLGYLVHHRGHTHTFILAPLVALASALLVSWLCGVNLRERLRTRRRAVIRLGLVALAGPVCHVLMDSWNSYGVHPLWPFDSRWYYGDRIFIVEPLLILAFLPFAFRSAAGRKGRIAWAAVTAFFHAVVWGSGFLTMPLAAALQGWFFLSAFVQWAVKPAWGRGLAVALSCFLVLSAFVGWGNAARREVVRELERVAPGEKVEMIAATPGPGNPLCWSLLVTTARAGGAEEVSRWAIVRFLPAVPAFTVCDRLVSGQGTFDFKPSALPIPPSGRLTWSGERVAYTSALKAIARESCVFDGLLRFSRFPAIKTAPGGEGGWLIGDLRFDRSRGRDFAELRWKPGDPCPKFVPGWDRPTGQRYLK